MNYKQQSRNRWTRVKLLREGGKTFREIGKIMGFSYQRAHQIFTGRPIYKNLSSEEKKRRYEISKEKRKACNKRWRKENPDKVLGYVNKWKAKNPEKALQHRRDYYQRHRKEILAKAAKRYRENKEYRLKKIEREKQRYANKKK